MRCESSDNLSRYIAGELTRRQRARVEAHLSVCAACRAEMEALRRLDTLLRAVPTATPPADLARQTLSRARVALGRRERRVLQPGRLLTSWGTMAASAVALCLVVWYAASLPGREGAPPPAVGPTEQGLIARAASSPAVPGTRPSREPAAPVLRAMQRPQAGRETAEALGRHAARAMALVPNAPSPQMSRPPAAASSDSIPTGDRGTSGQEAAIALCRATMHANEGDDTVRLLALENVAVAHAGAPEAADALLTAARLRAAQGDTAAADAAYRQVTAWPSAPVLAQAQAYRALGDLRRQSVGQDELAAYNYRRAAELLRGAVAQSPEAERATALIALGEVQQSLGDTEGAASAYARAAALGGDAGIGDETGALLAQVL
ncbi:MAG: hypothetical protein HPY69_06605 [Armatimonadetes bacterium]|nr:hypothetical protein [Armatimonadota bacterium]